MDSVCTACGLEGKLQLRNFLHNDALQGCFCNGGVLWRSDVGKARVDQLVDGSRFYWADYNTRHENIVDQSSVLALVCSICNEPATPTITKLTVNKVGCACADHKGRDYDFASARGKAILDHHVANSRLKWADPETRHDHIVNRLSRIALVCTLCNEKVTALIHHFVHAGAVGCACPSNIGRDFSWSADAGKARLDSLVDRSRFRWAELQTHHDNIVNSNSQIALVCTICNEKVQAVINQFVNASIGCGCDSSTERKVFRFVRAVLATRFPDRDLHVSDQHTFEGLVGVGGMSLRFDFFVYEVVDGHIVPLLYGEVDGGHHFSDQCRYGSTRAFKHTAFEHDERKEKHAIREKIPMARVEQETAFYDKANWACWLQSVIEAAVLLTLPSHIYRLSCGSHYVTGEYAQRRAGDKKIDVTLPEPDFAFVDKANVVAVPEVEPHVPDCQPKIHEAFAAATAAASQEAVESETDEEEAILEAQAQAKKAMSAKAKGKQPMPPDLDVSSLCTGAYLAFDSQFA